MSCSAVSCSSRTTKGGVKDPDLSFHSFPKCPEIRSQWIKAIKRDNWEPTKYSRLCSKHFEETCFMAGLLIKKLKSDAIPTIFKEYSLYYEPGSDVNSTNLDQPMTNVPKRGLRAKVKHADTGNDRTLHSRTQVKLNSTNPEEDNCSTLDTSKKKMGRCRCCLMYGKHDKFETEHSLALMQLNIFLLEASGASDRICRDCLQHVDTFLDFKKKVMNAQQELMKRLESQVQKPDMEINTSSESEPLPDTKLFIKHEELDLGIDNNEDWCVEIKPELDQTMDDQTIKVQTMDDQTIKDQTMADQTMEDQEKTSSTSDQKLCGKKHNEFTIEQNLNQITEDKNQDNLSGENDDQDIEDILLPYVITENPPTPPKPTDPVPVKLTKVLIPKQLPPQKNPITWSKQTSLGGITSSSISLRGKPIQNVKLTSGQDIKLAPAEQIVKLTSGQNITLTPAEQIVKLISGQNIKLTPAGQIVKLTSGQNIKLTPAEQIVKLTSGPQKVRVLGPVLTNKDKRLTPAVQEAIEPSVAVITPRTNINVRKYVEPIGPAVLRVVPMTGSEKDWSTEIEPHGEIPAKEEIIHILIENIQIGFDEDTDTAESAEELEDAEDSDTPSEAKRRRIDIFRPTIDQQAEESLCGEKPDQKKLDY